MSGRINIEVSGLYKIFGNNPRERALPLVRKGMSKADILEKTGCTVGINNASFSIKSRVQAPTCSSSSPVSIFP